MPDRTPLRRVPPPKPTAADLDAARTRLVPDLIRPGLKVLFVGINPGLYSAAIGHHFGRPGNRFWPVLHRSGFTPTLLQPWEEHKLLALDLGITNVVARASARADELAPDELVAGGKVLEGKIRKYRPRWVAVLGVMAFRGAFDLPKAKVGPQDRIFGPHTGVWVLPNPSGLNAHYQAEGLVKEFEALRKCSV
jgi:TDG/mug DNA glycosylase family protein